MMHRLLCCFLLALCPAVTVAQQTPDPWAALARGKVREARDSFLVLAERRDEVGALLAIELTRELGDWDRLEAGLLRARGNGGAYGHRIDALRLQAAIEAGQLERARSLGLEVGVLDGWWLVGPFDNERGGGFARELPPEQQLDPDATYEGKKRAVRWRPLPVRGVPGGRIDLDAMVRPEDQVLCYAATVLHSEREQDAVLWLGSDEAFAVFCNGRKLLARDVRRPLRFDQDAIPLRLVAGPNLLLLKVCDQEEEFGFVARVTQPDGARLAGVVERTSAADLRAAAATTPAQADPAAPELGARKALADAAARGDVDAAFQLAHLLLRLLPDDPNERRDHALARQAVAARPGVADLLHLLAQTRVRPALHQAEKDDNPRRHDLEAALAADPDHLPSRLALAQLELASIGNGRAAEAHLRRVLELAPGHAEAGLLLADALQRQDLRPLDERELLGHAARHPGHAALQQRAAELLRRRGERVAALQHAERAVAAGPTRERTAALLGDLLQLGRADAARARIERALALDPFDREPRRRLAELQRAEGDVDGALRTWGEWLSICPEDDAALVEVAELHGLRGARDAEIETLRRVLELNPNRKDQRRLLEFLEADVKPFYAAYELDGDAVLAEDRGPPADAKAANDPLHDVLRQTVVVAYRGGTSGRYDHAIRRVLSEQGARALDQWYVPHSFGEQRARILLARVIKADGQVLRPRLQGFWVDLPPLQPGDVVELKSRVDDLAPTFFGDIFGLQHSFASPDGNPVARSELIAILEPGREYRLQSAHGAPEPDSSADADGRLVHRWRMQQLARRAVEERSPSWRETVPLARITTYRDWDHFSQWWWHLIRRQIEVSPELRRKVQELTAGIDDELARIAAIYRFVTTDVRYTAWEFGVHGYKPYSTPVIFERRHGDCKDKALLLSAMLGELGIEAWPVLIWADPLRSADDLAVPLVDHFNHCISWLPPHGDRPAMYLDGTAIYHPLDTLPDMDQGARVLVVREGRGELQEISWVAPERNVDRRTIALTVEPDGDAAGRIELRPTGNEAVALRDELGNERSKQTEKIERELTREFGKSTVRALATSDLLDTSRPVTVDVEFDAQEALERQQGALLLKARFLRDELPNLARAESRTLPLLLGVPQLGATTLRYRLPPDWSVDPLPAPVQIERPFASYRLEWRQEAGEVVVERRLERRSPRIEPQEYPEFRRFAQEVDVADQRVVAIRPKEER